MSEPAKIDQFVSALRKRLNRHRFLDLLIRAGFIAAIVLLAVSLAYVITGYAVPRIWHLAATAGLLLGLALAWRWLRRSNDDAAHFADHFFGLKDAVASHLHFRRERRDGEVYELQTRDTAAQVDRLDLESVRYSFPTRLLSTLAVMVGACVFLAFRPASPEVLERLKIAAETGKKTGEINEFLEELAGELEKTTDPDALDPKEMREWVAAMKETQDPKEAMRQYADLERKMQEAARRLDQRRQEHLLAKAGEELQKAEEQESRALGKKLSEKQFREAAGDLEKLSPSEAEPEKLDEARKELAKLKSAAQRMASAADAASRSASQGSPGEGSDAASAAAGSGKGGKGSAGNGNGSGQGGNGGEESLESLLSQLDQSVAKLDQSLASAAREKAATGQCSSASLGQCQGARKDVLANLKKLGQCLSKCASRGECQSKLLSMCQKLGQCQGYLGQGQCQSLSQCLREKTGGGIGAGSVESRRDAFNEGLMSGGPMSQLSGQKGQGPSESTVESADDGDGVSSRRQAAAEREFRQQIESFVRREDVPDDVKDGVKVYFERIHQTETK